MAEHLLQCYNRGCGKKYDPANNGPEACNYHPGEPFFHDAYKGWSCCNKKSTDFSTFLSIPPCFKGPHSNVPIEEPTKKEPVEKVVVEPQVKPIPKQETLSRPSETEPMIDLPVSKSALITQNTGTKTAENSQEKTCTNASCGQKYPGDTEICRYHPGNPVFHEGMKYWSCCMKKTTDFQAFMQQEGCEVGSHVWKTNENKPTKEAACRVDMYQMGRSVVVNLFSKQPDPDKSYFKANRVKLLAHVEFEGDKVFEREWILSGIIDPQTSSVSLFPSKIEIKLSRLSSSPWKTLEFAP